MKLLKSLTWMLILVLAIGFVGCSDDDDDNNDPVGPTTTDHFEAIFAMNADGALFGNNITGDVLYPELTGASPADGSHFIIDFRDAEHYDAGHIEGAVNWALADLIDHVSAGDVPADAKVICVCYSGQEASHASAALNILGYDAWNLKFGMCGWTADESVNLGKWTTAVPQNDIPLITDAFTLDDSFDYPVRELETEDALVAVEQYIDEYLEAGWKKIASADVFANLSDGDTSNDPVILNYWTQEWYDVGHFDTAVQFNPFTLENLATVDPSKQIIIYCYTGQTSSKIVLWLNALGYDAWSMLYGVNSISTDITGSITWPGDFVTYHPPSNNYPVVPTEE